MQEFIDGLKKNFETNYKRAERIIGLPKYDTVFTDDFIKNHSSLMLMYRENERSFSHRQAGYFRGMISLVSKINDMEHPGWDIPEVPEWTIMGSKSQIKK